MPVQADLDKHLDRVRKLLALAGSTVNAHESALAAERAVTYLEKNPIPIRWYVRQGVRVQVVPLAALKSASEARARLRVVETRGDSWFFEEHRMKDAQAANALRKGCLYFVRHNYAVLVPAGHVEAYL